MEIANDEAALHELLAKLERELDIAYATISPAALAPRGDEDTRDGAMEIRIRIRELQMRRELVVARLATLNHT